MSVNWWLTLRDLFCKLYQECGGDCADLGSTPAQAVVVINSLAQLPNGPAFGAAADRERCLSAIQAAMLIDNSPDNGLSSADKTAIWGALAALKAKIIANPFGGGETGGGPGTGL